MTPTEAPMHAFRCNTCGHLEDSGNAGERHLPAACRTCGAGVSFDPRTGQKAYDDANWTVLADETDAELKKAGLTRDDVETHTPAPAADPGHVPMHIVRSTNEDLTVEDRVE